MSNFEIKANELPAVRIADAVGRKTNKNILFTVGGGLGDRLCAEPAIRFAMDHYKDCEFSLHAATPQVFRHLNFKVIYDEHQPPAAGKFLQLVTYAWGVSNQFFNPNLMHAVDYASVASLRGMLPDNYRALKLVTISPSSATLQSIGGSPRHVLVHVGDTWLSRTFPPAFWGAVCAEILRLDRTPVLIGQCKMLFEVPGNVTDLRNRLTLEEYLWLVQKCDTIVTNDSSPIHIAASGQGKIAFIPTCRRPDFLMHHRMVSGHPIRGWRMQAFYKAPMWDLFHHIPNTLDEWPANRVPEGHAIEEFLPDPKAIGHWIARTP